MRREKLLVAPILICLTLFFVAGYAKAKRHWIELDQLKFSFELPDNMATLKEEIIEGATGYDIEIIQQYKPFEYRKTGVFLRVTRWPYKTGLDMAALKQNLVDSKYATEVENSKISIGGEPTLSYKIPGMIWSIGLTTFRKDHVIEIFQEADKLGEAKLLRDIAASMKF